MIEFEFLRGLGGFPPGEGVAEGTIKQKKATISRLSDYGCFFLRLVTAARGRLSPPLFLFN